jgi:hypothetical protein
MKEKLVQAFGSLANSTIAAVPIPRYLSGFFSWPERCLLQGL